MSNTLKMAILAKPYRNALGLVAVLILLEAVVQQITPLLIKGIVDNLENLYGYLALIFLSNMASVTLTAIGSRLGDAVSGRIGKYLTQAFYHKILTLPQSYFDTTLSAKIINQLTRGIAATTEFIGASTNFILPSILQSIFTIGILTYFSPLIGLLAFIIFPLYIAISQYSTKKWGESEVKKNTLDDTYKQRVVEVIQNMKLVKTVNTQTTELSKADELLTKSIGIYDKQSFMYHVLNFARNSMLEGILILIMLVIFQKTLSKEFTLGIMVLMIQLLGQMRRPLFAMSFILERIQRAESGAKEFFEIMGLPAGEALGIKALKPKYAKPVIQFTKVSFKYEDVEVLRSIDLAIEPGQTLSLVGHSGAGKTTLVNLLLSLYTPSKGTISINDAPYSALKPQEIRSHFAYVFQDNELFSNTVFENVAYGTNATRKQVESALKSAYAYDFVQELPQGLDTPIGEKGTKLSGGQKQRLQIARAFVNPAPILILDEATSSLDAKSEAIIQNAILEVMKKKTVIIIAHRFSTLQHTDKIIVLDKGSIAEAGTPGELARKEKGIYAELLRYQVEGNQKLLAQYDLS